MRSLVVIDAADDTELGRASLQGDMLMMSGLAKELIQAQVKGGGLTEHEAFDFYASGWSNGHVTTMAEGERGLTSTEPRIAGECVRAFDFEPTADPGDGRTLEGYAAVFGHTARIAAHGGDFDEVIRPGAFARSLRQRTPVLQWEHGKDPRVGAVPIGRILEAREDSKGLFVRARLFDNPVVEPVRQAIAGGAVTGMSFRFQVPDGGDVWRRGAGGVELREVIHANVPEVSPVVFPAYAGTSVSLRSDRANREMVAYVARWNAEVLSDDGQGWRFHAHMPSDAFACWLASNPTEIPIMVNHGRDFDTDRPEPVLAARAGVWEHFEADEYGLLATGYLDDTPLGMAVAERIAAGELVACSYRADIWDFESIGQRDGLERLELRCLGMTEAGPTPQPADPGAVILSLGGQAIRSAPSAGVDRPQADVESIDLGKLLGRPLHQIQADAERQRHRQRWAVEDAAARIERICDALRHKRIEADRAYSFSLGPLKQRGDLDRYLDLEREAEQIKRDLLEAIQHDRGLFRDLCERHGIPQTGLLRNMRSGLARAR